MDPLKERLDKLEKIIITPGEMLGNYEDLPFAIFWYPPTEERKMRDEIRLLAIRIRAATGKEVVIISLAELLWQAIEQKVGIKALVEAEKTTSFDRAQDTVHSILTRNWFLADLLVQRVAGLSPDRHMVFLNRAATFAPTMYQMSTLLDHLKMFQVRIETVLFYPGTHVDLTTLQYMNLDDREAMGNYFVPIY